MILALLLLVLSIALAGRYLMLPGIARDAIAEASGTDVHFESLHLTSGGVTAHDLTLRIPGVAGEAGELLFIDHADLELRLGSLLPFSVEVEAVHLNGARLRVSQSQSTGALAAARLNLPEARSGRERSLLPVLTLAQSSVEYGLHDEAGRFAPLADIGVEGSARPDSETSETYEVSLRQILPDGRRARGLRVVGTVTPAESVASLLLRDFSFNDISAEVLPQRVRAWWTRAAISGDVAEASLEVTPDVVEAVVSIADVDLTLDVPLAYMDGAEAAPLQLRDARGAIRFDQDGVTLDDLRVTVQDLECSVSGRYEGYAEDSAVSLELAVAPFDIQETQGLLPFVPLDVQRELREFEFEQARLSGTIGVIRRDPEIGDSQPLRIRADFDVQQCVGKTSHFPYPVTGGTGHITFADGRLTVALKGQGRTGADLDISVSVVPKQRNSDVDVRVTATRVPVDDLLRDALWEESRRVIDGLMDEGAYERLLRAGLVRAVPSPEEAGVAAEPDAPAPILRLGAIGDVDVIVHRGEDTNGDYDHHVTIDLHEGDFLYEHFTYPLRVERGTIIVTDHDAWLDLPQLYGPFGEHLGSLSGTVILSRDGADVYEPTIEVSVDAMPLNRYLAHAIPAGAAEEAERDASGTDNNAEVVVARGDAPPSLGGRLIEALGLRGTASGVASISPSEDGGVDYHVECLVEDAAAAPGNGAYELTDIRGGLVVSSEGVRVENLQARHGETQLLLRGAFTPTEADAGGLELFSDLLLEVAGLNLQAPVQQLLVPFLESGLLQADAVPDLAALQQRYQPEGKADVTVRASAGQPVAARDAGAPEFETDLRLIDPAFALNGRRVRLAGVIEGVRVAGGYVHFDNAEAAILDGDDEAAEVRLNGQWRWRQPEETPPEATPMGGVGSTINLEVTSANLDSTVLRELTQHAGAAEVAALLAEHNVAGVIDADLLLSRSQRDELRVQGSIRPRRLELGELHLHDFVGSLLLEEGAVRLADLAADVGDGRIEAGGRLAFNAQGGDPDGGKAEGGKERRLSEADVTFAADLPDFDAADWAPLLGDIGARLSDLDLTASERLQVRDGRLRFVRTGKREEDRLLLEGIVSAAGASFDAGLPVEQLRGEVEVRLDDRPWQRNVQAWGEAESLRVRGVEMSDLRFHLAGGDDPGELLVPLLECASHDGEISGKARLLTGAQTRYEMQLQVRNVRLGQMLRDLRRFAAEDEHSSAAASDADERQPVRGRVDASLALRGVAGQSETLWGRCTARIAGEGVVELPVMLALIQVSNFVPPAGDRFDLAELDFYVVGDRLIFEKADLLGDTIWIDGKGRVSLDDMGIDMLFTTQGPMPDLGPIPDLFANLMLGLRDELVSMQATGTLYNPEFRPKAFAQTRRTLAEIFGTGGRRPERPIRRDINMERRPGGSE